MSCVDFFSAAIQQSLLGKRARPVSIEVGGFSNLDMRQFKMCLQTSHDVEKYGPPYGYTLHTSTT